MARLKICALLLFFINQAALALVLQHDVPLEKFAEFGQNPMFASVGKLTGPFHCTAFLVDDRTIVTAWNCFAGANVENYQFQIPIDGQVHTIPLQGVYRAIPAIPGIHRWPWIDFAVAYLSYPVSGIQALRISDNWPEVENAVRRKRAYLAGLGQLAYANQVGAYVYQGRHKYAGVLSLSEILVLESPHLPGQTLGALESVMSYQPGMLGVSSSSFGDSGAPILSIAQNGQPFIVGLVSGNPSENLRTVSDVPAYLSELGVENKPRPDLLLLPSTPAPIFEGYQTSRYFTAAPHFYHFVNQEKGLRKIETLTGEGAYNLMETWSGMNQRLGETISNTHSKADQSGRYYQVLVKNSLTLDTSPVEVDSLILDTKSSSFLVMRDMQIDALRVRLHEGQMHVNGKLLTEAFRIDHGLLSGFGIVEMKETKYPEFLKKEGHEPERVLSNVAGEIHLAEEPGQVLSIDGAYTQGTLAAYTVALFEDGKSPRLKVRGIAKLHGALNVSVHALQMQAHDLKRLTDWDHYRNSLLSSFAPGLLETIPMRMPQLYYQEGEEEYRWIVLEANAIDGKFDHFFHSGTLPAGYGLFLQQTLKHVIVIMKRVP